MGLQQSMPITVLFKADIYHTCDIMLQLTFFLKHCVRCIHFMCMCSMSSFSVIFLYRKLCKYICLDIAILIIASNFSGTNNSIINIRIIFQMKICKGFTSVAAWVEYAFYQIFKNILKGCYTDLYHH